MLLFSPSADRVAELKNLLHIKYKMTDLSPVRCFHGIEIERDRSRWILHIHQQRAVQKLLVTLGCFTNGTIAQVVTNSLSPLSGQHLYDGSGATV